ncbi:MFS transporter [Actinoplanes cyaneus]|uniref:MFS transporter n=1 Tax=Actinoplanes cyaneus TaxID=52696 RepID=A0A919IKH4_9ACTN|nr:MFS transporter [Actinoplanes cyaneus]MCW2137695.1 MFS transporter, NNP family, nitrate/nitrite transporter [Actinoplanes cyaneus]GID65098.1 MFS transporter [Actinoplanes cyaneus]
MTAVAERPAASSIRGHWIDDWNPEDPAFWANGGSKIAKRNLIFSIFSEHIGFSVWSLWSVMVLFLGPQYGFDPAQKFLLTAVPTLVGALLRIPYTFAVARFGGRNWTIISASMLLVPAVLAAFLIEPGVSFTTCLILGALAGVGGGNFASSMANINAFFPNRYKGWALGINAGGGNIGVAAVQLVGLFVLAVFGAGHPGIVAGIYIPLIVLATIGSAIWMDNLSQARNEKRGMRDAVKESHTWVMSLLYIGTFGSFIGFGFAFGQVLQVQFHDQFDTPIKAAYLTFLGPLLGSLIRPVGGALADRLGGAKVTFVNFIAMGLATTVVLVAAQQRSLPLYLVGFISLFVLSGVGNGSTYKMIPAIFKAKYADDDHQSRRISGAVIGVAGAIGGVGGVLVNLAFRQSFLTYKDADAAYLGFIGFYALCVIVTWVVYLRPGARRTIAV